LNAEFRDLDQQARICAEYVWVGGSGIDLRSKMRVLDGPVSSADQLPWWNFDGSSTGQAPGHDSEVLLKPVAIFRDPFRRGDNILVLSETYQPVTGGEPIPLSLAQKPRDGGVNGNNNRHKALTIFSDERVSSQKPWFGLEQEYGLYTADRRTPLGFPQNGYPAPQGPYYCGAGVTNAYGRDIAEAHAKACLYAGIKISGINGEVMPGQWEYQVGPCEGISAGDHLWMSRYIMYRICEKFNVFVTFDPKPMEGDWNGAGCHTNYSTQDMRTPNLDFSFTPPEGPYKGKELKGGFAKIIEAVERLGKKHFDHIVAYGQGNERRLTGRHETADMNTWSYGVANRGASVRIPRDTDTKGYGYFEDRRPASNMDPYVVTGKIAATTLLPLETTTPFSALQSTAGSFVSADDLRLTPAGSH